MRLARWLVAAGTLPAALAAQETQPAAHEDTISVWASVALGAATSEHSGLIGANLSVWGFRNRIGVVVRRSGGFDFDSRDVYDTGVLFAVRTSPDYLVFAAAVGPVVLTDDSSNRVATTDPGVGFAIEASVNARYAGLGLSAFGAVSARNRFVGVGFAVQLGKMQ